MKIQALYNSKILQKGLEFASDNSVVFVAATSFILSNTIRPLSILAAPKVNQEDKKYGCAKSFASSPAGLLTTLAISQPVSSAIKKINKNPENFLKQDTIKNLLNNESALANSKQYKFATQLFKLGLGFLIASPRIALTSALIPPVMSKVFGIKKEDNKKEEYALPKNRLTSNQIKNSKNEISFLGLADKTTDLIAKGVGKVIDTKAVQNASKKLYKTNFEHPLISASDIFTTILCAISTKKSKKIQEERKAPMINSSCISTGMCVVSSYFIDSLTKKPVQKFIDNFTKANANNPKLNKYLEGIRVAKSAFIMAAMYYIVIPFVSTIFADKIREYKEQKSKVFLNNQA